MSKAIKERLRAYSNKDSSSRDPLKTTDKNTKQKGKPAENMKPDGNDNEQVIEQEQMIQTIPEMPTEYKHLSTQQWWEMYHTLNVTLSDIQRRLQSHEGLSTKVTQIETLLNSVSNRMDAAEESINSIDLKQKLLTNISIFHDERMHDLDTDLKVVRQDKNKLNIVVFGILEDVSEKHEALKTKVSEFFKGVMCISQEMKVREVYRRGARNNRDRPVLIKLRNFEDKRLIFNHVKNIQGKINEKATILSTG